MSYIPARTHSTNQSETMEPETITTSQSITGDEFREIRMKHGWTQVQLAAALGLHRDQVGRLELGKSPVSRTQMLALYYLDQFPDMVRQD